MRLKKPQLSHFLEADPTRRKICDTAVFKFHTRVGNVRSRREYRNADCTDLLHRSRNQTEHDVDIVNHEVENDINIQTSRRKRGKPVNFEELWPCCNLAGESHDWIESLHVTDLQHAIVSRR